MRVESYFAKVKSALQRGNSHSVPYQIQDPSVGKTSVHLSIFDRQPGKLNCLVKHPIFRTHHRNNPLWQHQPITDPIPGIHSGIRNYTKFLKETPVRMGFHSAKKHNGFSPRQQTSPLSTNPRRQVKHQPPPQRNAFNYAKTPHHNHLPLRQKLTRTVPNIPSFVPWTPESDPEASQCPNEEDECPASLRKPKVVGKEGLHLVSLKSDIE